MIEKESTMVVFIAIVVFLFNEILLPDEYEPIFAFNNDNVMLWNGKNDHSQHTIKEIVKSYSKRLRHIS